MASVGERIKVERESRNTSLDDMATATGIGLSYLESLEKGEYHELPGPAFGKLYIRAYAEVLGFDPQPWIDEYDREHRLLQAASGNSGAPVRTGPRPMAEAIARWRESKMAAAELEPEVEPEVEAESDVEVEDEVASEPVPPPSPKPAPAPAPPPAPAPIPRAPRIFAPGAIAAATVIVAAVVYFALRGADNEAPPKPAAPAATASAPAAPARAVPAPVTLPPPPPVVAEAPKPALPKPAVVKAASPPAELTVTEFGVGRRIVDLALEGVGDRFTEGDRVSFASRVIGGTRGSVIRHVWIYEGRAQQTITLRVNGPDWRTHTNKTLGKPGAWAVEARDGAGKVLARSEFTCEPRSR